MSNLIRYKNTLITYGIDHRGKYIPASPGENQVPSIWTDGSVGPPNPGPGGYAACILTHESDEVAVVAGGSTKGSNNQFEFRAALEGLRYLVDHDVRYAHVFTDSGLLVGTMTQWADQWVRAGILEKKSNPDLVRSLLDIRSCFKGVWWSLVKGHSGIFWNEQVDRVAGSCTEKVKRFRQGFGPARYLVDMKDITGFYID